MRTRRLCTAEEERVLRNTPVYITPSSINVWQGTYEGDARYSGEQLAWMTHYGIDPETVDFVEVPVSAWQLVMPAGRQAPWRKMACPILRREGGRLVVLAPLAREKRVYPDGEIAKDRFGGRRWAA